MNSTILCFNLSEQITYLEEKTIDPFSKIIIVIFVITPKHLKIICLEVNLNNTNIMLAASKIRLLYKSFMGFSFSSKSVML